MCRTRPIAGPEWSRSTGISLGCTELSEAESVRQALKRNSGPRMPCRSSSRDASPLAVSATPMTVFTARPELARDPFEEVGFGDRAVEVEDDGPVLSTAVFGIQVRHVIMFPEAKLL
jgi:hypothetical protein